jgi:hypothetical protein
MDRSAEEALRGRVHLFKGHRDRWDCDGYVMILACMETKAEKKFSLKNRDLVYCLYQARRVFSNSGRY